MTKPRSVPRASREDVPELPPLDGETDAPESAEIALELELPDDGGGLDDAVDDRARAEEDEVEPGPESGWLDGAEDAEDADVGDLADEVRDDGPQSWLDEAEAPRPGDGLEDAGEELSELWPADDGAEGPEDDTDEVLEEQPPLATEDADDEEYVSDEGVPLAAGEAHAPPAVALPASRASRVAPVRTDGVVLAAAASPEGRVLLCGDGVFALAQGSSEERDGRPRAARRVAATEELVASVGALGGRAFVASTVRGEVLRSEDDGARWERAATFAADGAERAPAELLVERGAEPARLWARAHAGGLFVSRDGGRAWEGPVLEQPVRALAVDPRGPGVLAVSAGWTAEVRHSADGARWEVAPLKLPSPATCAACRGELWAFAFDRGAGLVTLDAGRTTLAWPLLEGATALAMVETDDGAPQLLFAVYDEAADRSVVVAAAFERDGGPRGARRLADLHVPHGAAGEDAEARVEALVPLDPAGRRVLVVSPAGVLLLVRDGDAGV